jgi:ADP-heptose:LPS heptosyltransferase
MNPSPSPNVQEPTWINPIGGYGDMLMVSGVIKQAVELDPHRSFNLVRRSMYRAIFQNHPAIRDIGYPLPGAHIIGTDYWAYGVGANENRPYQILARMFGLPTPAEEILYLPGASDIDPLLEKAIPWKNKNIIIAPASDSPRKMMRLRRWEFLVTRLKEDGFFVIQMGRLQDVYIKNSYSLLGMTSPVQLVGVLKRADAVITLDNFAMHAAHLAGVPALVLWGPTAPETYGYPGQHHFRGAPRCDQMDSCLGPKTPNNYNTPCPLEGSHCMDLIPLEDILKTVQEM